MPNVTFRSPKLLVVLGALSCCAFGGLISTQTADAQVLPNKQVKLKSLGPLPDLAATVTAPATINQGGTGSISIKVDNLFQPGTAVATKPGLVAIGSPDVANIALRVLFAGFKVTGVQGSSGFACQPTGAGGTAPNTGVQCTGGTIAAGASATITVTVQENGSPVHYCGPIYSDVLVDPYGAVSERSESNNRALAVTDTQTCIN